MQHYNHIGALMDYIYDRTLSNIKCAYVAKIVKITKPTAKVQPLAMLGGKKQPMVENVFFTIIPRKTTPNTTTKLDYHIGDNVLVVVLDHDNEYFKNKGTFQVKSNRKHAIDFSVIVGKIANKSDFK